MGFRGAFAGRRVSVLELFGMGLGFDVQVGVVVGLLCCGPGSVLNTFGSLGVGHCISCSKDPVIWDPDQRPLFLERPYGF